MDIMFEIGKGILVILVGFWGGSVYAERIKNKVVYFTKSITFQTVGRTTISDHWGKIEVYCNNARYDNIYFFTVMISNNTIKNAPKDFKIQFAFDPPAIILQSSGEIYTKETNSALQLHLDAEFSKALDTFFSDYKNLSKDEQLANTPSFFNNKLIRNARYLMPIFNKKNVATFNFLVGSESPAIPVCRVQSFEPGFSIKNMETNEEKEKYKNWSKILIGLISLLPLYSIIKYSPTNTWVAIWIFVSSLLAYPVGWGLMHLFKNFKKS